MPALSAGARRRGRVGSGGIEGGKMRGALQRWPLELLLAAVEDMLQKKKMFKYLYIVNIWCPRFIIKT